MIKLQKAEVPNIERVERLYNELAEAPSIIERLPQHRREELLNKLRGVQLLPSSEASQAEAHQFPQLNRQGAGWKPQGWAGQQKLGAAHFLAKTKLHEKRTPK